MTNPVFLLAFLSCFQYIVIIAPFLFTLSPGGDLPLLDKNIHFYLQVSSLVAWRSPFICPNPLARFFLKEYK